MGTVELLILAFALSMDAFAVSICLGLGFKRASFKNALIVGLYFGIFQALMPLIGYFAATLFAEYITVAAPWIAFALLLILGIKMIWGSFKKEETENQSEPSLGPKKMLPFAVATSIDALAVGVTLALVNSNIFVAASLIGIITLVVCMIGVKLGQLLGLKFKSWAEIIGGVILILIGLKIFLEHIGVF